MADPEVLARAKTSVSTRISKQYSRKKRQSSRDSSIAETHPIPTQQFYEQVRGMHALSFGGE